MHLFYLHGFASSPESSKGTFFARKFAELGLRVHAPDFNQPDFAGLTISRMLSQLEAEIAALPPGQVVLLGSSLGGLVAIEAAARQANRARHPISRLALLAPAVELDWDRWMEESAVTLDAWRAEGSVEVRHHADSSLRPLNFTFYEDARRYAASTRRLPLPMLIFQGRHDQSVDPASVARFAGRQPDARLHLLDDGHQLKGSLELIWRETSAAIWPAGDIHPQTSAV